jgi:hypothetical protein
VWRSPWNPAAIFLVALMAIGSVVMWLGVPIGLIYLASQVSNASQLTMGPVLIILLGLPIGMTIVGKCLGWLDRRHQVITGAGGEERRDAPWLKSMRGERTNTRRAGVLDKVMIISVSFALVCFAIWFFGFAGSSLPGA